MMNVGCFLRLILLEVLALGVTVGCAPVETGYLTPSNVHYTSQAPLGDARRAAFVLGVDGAVEKPGGVLTVENLTSHSTQSRTVADPAGSFVVGIELRAGDTVRLAYAIDGVVDTHELRIEDKLDKLPPPEDCGTCTGALVSPPDPSGNVTVDLEVLDEPKPPLVVFNRGSNASRLADDVKVPVSLPGKTGDEICIFRFGAQAQSVTLCAPVP